MCAISPLSASCGLNVFQNSVLAPFAQASAAMSSHNVQQPPAGLFGSLARAWKALDELAEPPPLDEVAENPEAPTPKATPPWRNRVVVDIPLNVRAKFVGDPRVFGAPPAVPPPPSARPPPSPPPQHPPATVVPPGPLQTHLEHTPGIWHDEAVEWWSCETCGGCGCHACDDGVARRPDTQSSASAVVHAITPSHAAERAIARARTKARNVALGLFGRRNADGSLRPRGGKHRAYYDAVFGDDRGRKRRWTE